MAKRVWGENARAVSGSVDTNPDGIYSLIYDTSYLPVGDFSVNVEHIEKIVTVNP